MSSAFIYFMLNILAIASCRHTLEGLYDLLRTFNNIHVAGYV